MNEIQRKAHNDDLINRMRRGESMSLCKASDTWFPPRPVIKKKFKTPKPSIQVLEFRRRNT